MQFSPCKGGENCSSAGEQCSGCGRDHSEIRETRELIQGLIAFARKMEYDNPQEFFRFVGDKALKKMG